MEATFHLALRYKKRLFTLFHLNQMCTVSIATPTLHSSNCCTYGKCLTLWRVGIWIFQNQYQNDYPSSCSQIASDKGWCRLFVLFCEKYPAQLCGLLTQKPARKLSLYGLMGYDRTKAAYGSFLWGLQRFPQSLLDFFSKSTRSYNIDWLSFSLYKTNHIQSLNIFRQISVTTLLRKIPQQVDSNTGLEKLFAFFKDIVKSFIAVAK